MMRAICLTSVLYMFAKGVTSQAPSPNLVKYPIMSSLWFDVPMTM